ncbi:MAG: hypothetical protein QOJ52_1556 [Acidimicrobiaceae bacterium]|nr:hypothetical protein [Acidimicrobiaceae bacterium]
MDDTVASRYMVVSADCHGGADVGDYRQFLEPKFRNAFDEWARSYEVPYEDLKGDEGGRNWDSARRLRDLERDGIVAEVVYPNTVPPFFSTSPLGAVADPGDGEEMKRRWAGLRAHNRWLADFCSAAPGRRAGIIQINLHDIDASVREIHWAASVGLTGGVLLPGAPPGSGLPPLYAGGYYDSLWSALEETGLPLNCHSGGAAPRPTETPQGHVLFMLEMCWWDHRVLRHMIVGGVFERHPSLHAAFTEAGVAWIPQELASLEGFFDSMRTTTGSGELSFGAQVVGGLSLRPSEYWRRQCHVGASFMHRSDINHIERLGAETIMWGSDYPHLEGSFPYSRQAIASTFAGVPAGVTERIVGFNAAALYGLDIDALSETADVVGPTRETVHAGIKPGSLPSTAAKCPAFAGLMNASGQSRWGDNRRTMPAWETDSA